MPFAVTPDGVRLYFEAAGRGEPLLLIPGQGADHHGWDALGDDFVDSFRVIVFDPRGTGLSDKPSAPPPYTVLSLLLSYLLE